MRIAGWLLWAGVGCSKAPEPAAAPPAAPAVVVEESAVSQDVRITRDRERSLFAELGKRGLKPRDLPESFAGAAVDRSVDQPLGVDLGLTLGGQPLFFVKDGAAVVDIAVFDGLAVVDATNPPKGWHGLGRLADPDAADLDDVVRLLVEADVILTWAHIGSELTLTPVETAPPKARGGWRLKGTHTYFTNEENVDEIEVGIVVTEDGQVLVGPPPPAG